jgi:hypothetical protein
MDSVAGGDFLDLVDAGLGDEASSLGEGFEAALEGQGHAFKEASVGHVGERMAIQDAIEIRRESHSARDLSEASEEDFGVRHLCVGRQVLWVASITDDCAACDAA